MTIDTKKTFKYVKKMVGKEFKRVLEEQGLTLEEASKLAGIITPNVIIKIEDGRSNRLFGYFKLMCAYNKRIKIELVD